MLFVVGAKHGHDNSGTVNSPQAKERSNNVHQLRSEKRRGKGPRRRLVVAKTILDHESGTCS